MEELIREIENLCAIVAPSGREHHLSEYIVKRITPFCSTIEIDKAGNIIAKILGNGCTKKSIGFLAHMDSVGLIITNITNSGEILFGSLSSIKPDYLLGQKVRFTNGTEGIVECKNKDFSLSDGTHQLYIDIDAYNKQDAEELVQIGDMATRSPQFWRNKRNISGAFLDNRVGCACLVQLISRIANPANDLYFVFSVQEEIGGKGASIVAHEFTFDTVINIDATIARTWASDDNISVTLSNGPALKISDGTMISDPELFCFFERIASDLNLKIQREALVFSGCDAGSFTKFNCGVSVMGVSFPCKYLHTAYETMCLDDIEAAFCLMEKFVMSY